MSIKTTRTEFTHDLMVEVMKALYPQLSHGQDYVVGHYIDATDGSQRSEPFFTAWRVKGLKKPNPEGIKKVFEANPEKYLAAFARRQRDEYLKWSDGRAEVPLDAPESFKNQAAQWVAFRRALRDITEQPNFPFEIDWPQIPGT